MYASVFRGLVLVVALAGCSDRADKNGDPWTLGSDTGADAAQDLTVAPDTAIAADVRPDMGMPDMTLPPDAAPDMPDVGAGLVTVTGWHSFAFEHSGFIEARPGLTSPLPDGRCDPYLIATPPAESWWVSGEALPVANPMVVGFGGISLMTLTGRLTERGQHGHLGSYDRELFVESGERHACQTAAALGHCVRPFRSDVCVIPEINDPAATMRSTLVVTYPGIATTPVSYELHVIFGENVGDGRSDAVVRWQLDGDSAMSDPIYVADMANVELVQEVHGLFYSEIQYEQLEGWISYSEGNADGWYVSISGVQGEDPSAGPNMHVWGWFDVTEVIALP